MIITRSRSVYLWVVAARTCHPIIGPRRLFDCSRDRQIRIHHDPSDFHNRSDYQVLRMERVPSVEDVQHPIVREALKLVGIRDTNLEITSMADIPSGNWPRFVREALHCPLESASHIPQEYCAPQRTGRQACDIEINRLGNNRQTGPIHRVLWRHHVLSFSFGRTVEASRFN